MSGIFAERRATRNGIVVPMDVVLEKTDNKPAKDQSGTIGFSRQKAAACKWKFIMYEKAKYTSLLREWCFIDDIEEYSLHLTSSQSITEDDARCRRCIRRIMEDVKEGFNPFAIGETIAINIAKMSHVYEECREFLIAVG